MITNVLDWYLYTLLSEKQKEKLAKLFSDRQKDRIKRITKYGKKHSQKMKVKQLKDHLYSLGFTNLALEELKEMYQYEKDAYMKRLVAWELMLWYANQYTNEGAHEALTYVTSVKTGEKGQDQLRRIAIVEAECLDRIGKKTAARDVLQHRLSIEKHPDVYLGLANLEATIEQRLDWINKAYRHFHLHPITFTTMEEPTYDDLHMKETAPRSFQEGKVSVILPAYNAEIGIQIAVESILAQTWENLELLIVDDCSTDNTFQVMKQYAEKDDRVKIFSTPNNSGPYVARNIALQAATGDFVTVNDADDWSHEKKIATQVTHLLKNPSYIANSSAHARLTEDLKLYRRGTPGRYIFPNMSSIMFRREPVLEKLGFWDSVRFAADGEFKRRLIKVFGKDSFIDLDSGPLSLPRQSVASLTSSSAFGYNGFFMGVRKEYVESLEFYHETHADLYYPYPQKKRPFPVPEPMWPEREEKVDGKRSFDIVIAADFRMIDDEEAIEVKTIKQLLATMKNGRIGLVQMYRFDMQLPLEIAPTIRQHIDGGNLQMLVYGEKINTEKLLILDYNVVGIEQKYIPVIYPKQINVLVQEVPRNLEQKAKRIKDLFDKEVKFIPMDADVRVKMVRQLADENTSLISHKDWVLQDES